MGNSQTSANEATVAFFTSFGLVFAIGVAAALHAWFLLHRHWFRCDERRITERGRPGYSWYSRLYKPRYWPGTLAYLLFYVFVYFFQAYTLFRVWINVPVQKDQYGIAFIWVGMIWGLFNAVGTTPSPITRVVVVSVNV
jgi:tryptophan-rich sensory protein